MSGLFLNYYTVNLEEINTVSVPYKLRSEYPTKENFNALKEEYPNCLFYSSDDKILFWTKDNTAMSDEETVLIDLKENYKLLSRFISDSIITFLKGKKVTVKKNSYSHSWEIKSSKDYLNGEIPGLKVNRVIELCTYFFTREEQKFIGYTLSTCLKNSFTWDKKRFIENGIDVKGLKGKDDIIFANTHSIKRFLESKGLASSYNSIILPQKTNAKSFEYIEKISSWLNDNRNKIRLPFGLRIYSITKRYLPFENDLIKSEIIYKPQRYFYSNRTDTKNLRFYDQMVKTYQPYSLELFQNDNLNFGVICPKEYQGETEGFASKIKNKLIEVFHFKNINFVVKTVEGKSLDSYKSILYDKELINSSLIYIVVDKEQEKLEPKQSPYYVCKAKLIGNGIPTQDIQIETIRQNLNAYTMSNLALNSYAKLGGTAWTIEKEDRLKDELIVGIGSTVTDENKYVLGIAQVFHNDGRYMTGDCSPLSTFENYSENLENHLYNILKPLVEQMNKSGKFRLIFHLFKSASERYEIQAINKLQERLSEYDFEFALVHLGYGHNFRFYYNDGKYDTNQGTYVQLSANTALLHFVKSSDLPLKIDIDKRSTFTSLFYISKQIYWFSHLSHRSYIPSKRTVTLMYPSLMARMTEELKKVDGWDFERLNAVSDKLWFI